MPAQEEPATYGKYGLLRKRYLKEHRRATYTTLLTTGQLTHHLNEVDAQAREMVEALTAQMAQAQDITERRKAQDQFAWVGAMNNIRNAWYGPADKMLDYAQSPKFCPQDHYPPSCPNGA